RAFGPAPAGVGLRVSGRRIVVAQLEREHGVSAEAMAGGLAALDKVARDPAGAKRQLEGALAGPSDLLASAAASLASFFAGLRQPPGRGAADLLEAPAAEPLRECVDRLKTMGLGDFVDVDFRIVRGLAYYTGLVFELFDAKKSLRAICGGGRYDDLIEQIAGTDLPCVGFGMGDVVLGELLRERQSAFESSGQLDAFLIAVSAEDVAPVVKLAHELRDRGVAVEYGLRPAAIRKQLELAAARGAPRAVIIGPDERAAQAAVVRDLRAGTAQKVPVATLLDGFFR